MPTVFAARQFINHGHVKVNGRRVNIASYQVKVNDVVEVKEASKQLALVLEARALGERDVPDYIEVDDGKVSAKLDPHSGAQRGALPGDDGAASRRRILFALIAKRASSQQKSRPHGRLFCCRESRSRWDRAGGEASKRITRRL